MRVALIGASGRVGSRILRELVSRGHQVTGIARNPENIEAHVGVSARRGDLLRPEHLATELKGHDAVVSSVLFTQSDPALLLRAVRLSGVKRYLVVGGAGSLEVSPGIRLIDTPDFPPAYLPEAGGGAAFLDMLRTVDDVDWTFLSPSYLFLPGERTGVFRIGKDQLLSNESGSSISFEDYAVALVDELENPKNIRSRFTVGY
jgi:putative NADH-flavin reductase